MVTKQYTFFKWGNISISAILTNLFRKVYITKPISSRPANSETYIVGIDYQGPFKEKSLGYNLVKMIEDKIANYTGILNLYLFKTHQECPLLSKDTMEQEIEFLKVIKLASNIFERQIVYM